ncbi:hypothetical protein ACX3O0_06735 [Homoserinimonas sp. A447]
MTLFDNDGSMPVRDALSTPGPGPAPSLILIASGGVALFLGVGAGFFEREPCGSAFIPRDVWFDVLGDCSAAVGTLRALAIVLMVIGVAAIVGGVILLVRRNGRNQQAAAEPAPFTSIASQITELSRLHREGALDDAEFAAAKRTLLGG